MKLLRLKINCKFNSLGPGFELNFRKPFDPHVQSNNDWAQFHPYCFAGLNGSGKSNVLEALSHIFFHLENCANVNQPENFKDRFNSTNSTVDAYEIAYYIKPKNDDVECRIENMVLVKVTKKVAEAPKMTWTPYPFEAIKERPVTAVTAENATIQAPSKSYLPDLIVAYSSGENEILSIPYLKARLIHFDEYKEDLINNREFYKPESSLLYIDYEMSQAVLLANYLFQDKETVLSPLYNELSIVDITRFRMNLNIGHKVEKINILEQLTSTISKFKACSTSSFKNGHRLVLDFWINDETKRAFKENFTGGILELFQAFQILYTLNYRTVDYKAKSKVYGSKGYYTQGKIPNPAPGEKVFYFLDYYLKKEIKERHEVVSLLLKQLSDGEQQFLHTLGICLMLKSKSVLLLLDEPETHFNPDWRSKFISVLQQSLAASGSNNMEREILITSHSPFIISDCFPDKVVVFQKNIETGLVEAISAHEKNFNTFGTSVSIVLEEIFKKQETIPNYSLGLLKSIENRVFDTIESIQQAKKDAIFLGESVEKVLLFRKLIILEKKLRSNSND